jgi:hypothetical protein
LVSHFFESIFKFALSLKNFKVYQSGLLVQGISA